MARLLLAAPALCLLWAAPAFATDTAPPRKPWDLRAAAVWSNICHSQATGDAMGMRLFVRPEGKAPRVVMQLAQGGLLDPQATTATLSGKSLTFSPAGGGETFTGAFEGDLLTLKTARLKKTPIRLHRRPDDKGFQICTAGEGVF